jgi:hypothetical protein
LLDTSFAWRFNYHVEFQKYLLVKSLNIIEKNEACFRAPLTLPGGLGR